MKYLIDKFNKHPYIVLVGWLATIIALIISIVVPIIQARKVQVDFSYTTNLLVTDSLSEMDGLDIIYHGNTINQLSVTTCEISNTGNATIEDADVYEKHKISIYPISDDVDILFACLVSQSFDTINSQVLYDDKRLTLRFNTLEKGDKIILNIYHTGGQDSAFKADGKIKEGKIILSTDKIKSIEMLRFISSLGIGIMGIIVSVLSTIEKKLTESKKKNFLRIVSVCITVLFVIFIVATAYEAIAFLISKMNG